MKVVILAGGRGTRLRPYTQIVPKPLLPLKGMPILEHIINHIKSHGITDIIISIGHLGYQIKNYFGDGKNHGVNIEYIEEERPLGTAGCLSLLKEKLNETFILYGGDNITTINLTDFIRFHKEKGGIATVALFEFEEKVKWGIYELDEGGAVKKFLEKPTFKHNAGTMIFCLEPRIFDFIAEKPDKPLNITDDVIPKLLEKDEKIFGFPFSGYWMDIGDFEDYQKANNK